MNRAPKDERSERWHLLSDLGPSPETDASSRTPPSPPDMRGQCLMFCPRCGMPATLAAELCGGCGARRCVGCGD